MNTGDHLEHMKQEIDLYLDNRLNPKAQEQLTHQINHNPSLKKELDKEQHFRNFIKQNVKRPTMPADFYTQIKNKLKP